MWESRIKHKTRSRFRLDAGSANSSPTGVAKPGKRADQAAHFQFHERGGDDVGGQSAALDDAVHWRFIRGHGGEDGGLLFREFRNFRGGFGDAGFAGEGQLAEIIENVAGVGDECGAVADELVATGGGWLVDRTGDGENRFAVLGGEVGGDQGAGPSRANVSLKAAIFLASFGVGISFGVITTMMILMTNPIVTSTTIAVIVAWFVSALLIMFLLSLYPAIKLSKTGILKIAT